MKFKNIIPYLLLAFSYVLTVPSRALADLPSADGAATSKVGEYEFASGEVDTIIETVLKYFLGIVIIAAVFFIIKAGWTFVTAGGDQDKVAGARKEIMYAAIGVVIALVAMGIVNLVLGVVK